MQRINSILLLDKKEGLTSFASLGKVKRSIDKKVGHCGTLDKFASGLMIVLTNRFTKLNPIFSNQDKEYLATIEFGKETTTLDPEGEIVKETRIPTLLEIEDAIKNHLTGKIEQEPPIYSALHVNGKRAYQLARSGEIDHLEKRSCEIYNFEIIEYNAPLLKCRIHVSKGTYIRSIARDLGFFANSSAYVLELRRTKIGKYSIEDAIDLSDENLNFINETEKVLSKIEDLKIYQLTENEDNKLMYGHLPKLPNKGLYRLVFKGITMAIARDNKLMVLLK